MIDQEGRGGGDYSWGGAHFKLWPIDRIGAFSKVALIRGFTVHSKILSVSPGN